ncbi:uncharacterized protein TRIADDRAFT_52524 [Trichoplax adhaerens]|uniref:U6 snRNA phosphodiesterase 1 n=1 Tax=Trichoplax adhaerens TaxID=10228 RepID=B3RJ07_TRIAD|nr:hypothetical protein TRIADDRAFT_52524 [Trichoplax adhaerens]EDV29781.1 hypothetical protein TRIADDRAFT_52524 [Trichoplax adhaerens]|eukprot:XP_002108983.1 hypothetical protein TRIADDRAFT_52524 [Trichoplax adhaerens]
MARYNYWHITHSILIMSGGGLFDVVVADLISTAKPALPTLERIIEGELHISLSKNVHIGFHIMQPLMNDIKAALTTKTRFNCYMNSIAVYPNDDYTRTFLAIEIYGGYEQLRSLTNSINECFRKYQLPPFYEPPSFHISIGWCPGNQVDKFNQSIMNKLQTKLEEYLEDLNPVTIEYLECRCGNKLYKFSLLV